MARLVTYKLHVSVDAVVSLEFIATTLAEKHMATVLPNLVGVGHWQRLKSLFTDITCLNLFLSLALYLCASPDSSSSQSSGHSTCREDVLITALLLSSNTINSPTNRPAIPADPVASR